MIRSLFDDLLERHGRQGWWPLWDRDAGRLRYRPGEYSVPDGRRRVEVVAGTILAQNTSWRGASGAVGNLVRSGLDRWSALAGVPTRDLERLVRPARFYRQKARRLRSAAEFFGEYGEREDRTPDRRELLDIRGVGPETADCILLYGYGVPVAVVDAYLRRVLRDRGRGDVADGTYEELSGWVEGRMPEEAPVLNELHALVVAEGKRISGNGRDDGSGA